MEIEPRTKLNSSDSLIKAISKENVHFICSAQVCKKFWLLQKFDFNFQPTNSDSSEKSNC